MNQISLCMIVKNEENNLDNCLKRISEYVDEIVIVDTGSSDDTIEIAKKYTDKIYNFTWINDFAAARNYAISKASNEYILVLDGDEFTIEIDIATIQDLIAQNPMKVGKISCVNEYFRNGIHFKYTDYISRIFSKKYYYFEGIIHEQVTRLPNLDMETLEDDNTYHIPLTVLHSGYEGNLDIRTKKTRRNIELLKVAHKNNPKDSYIIYQLGKSYYMEEDYLSACDYFEQALDFDLDPNLAYVQDLVESYGYSLINSKQYDIALQLINVYDEFSSSADFVFMIALVLMNTGNFNESINEFIKATTYSHSKMEGVNNYMAFYNIGVIFECLGNKETAIKYYEKAGSYEPAKLRLETL